MVQKHGAHGEVTQAKMERFCCLFLSRYVVVFSQLGDKYYSRKSEAHVKKKSTEAATLLLCAGVQLIFHTYIDRSHTQQ